MAVTYMAHPPPLPVPPDDPRLEYRTYTPGPARSPVDVATLIFCALTAVLLTVAPLFVVPRFEDIFRDFGTKLPAVTVALLRLSRALAGGLVVVVWVLAAVPVVVSIPLGLTGRRMLRLVTFLLLAGAVLWVVLALFMPYVTLIQTVSGGAKKGG